MLKEKVIKTVLKELPDYLIDNELFSKKGLTLDPENIPGAVKALRWILEEERSLSVKKT